MPGHLACNASMLLFIVGCARTDRVTYRSNVDTGDAQRQAADGDAAGGGDDNPTDDGVLPIQGTTPVAAVYPQHGADWNDYVSNTGGGQTAWSRPDAPCGTSENYYFGCLHGGELRQFAVPGWTTCNALTAQDDLGVFGWSCSDATRPISFHSRGLNPGRGLRDLVTPSGWIPNRVTVFSGTQAVFQTPTSVWWQNPVTPLPANPLATDLPVSLNAARTIYVVASDTTTSGYSFFGSASDKIAIVTLGSAVLRYSGYSTGWCVATTGAVGGGSRVLICAGGVRYAWIEARLQGQTRSVTHGIYLGDGVQFTRVHDTEVAGGPTFMTNGITLDSSLAASNRSNLVNNSTVHEVSGAGFNTRNRSTYDTLSDCRSIANGTGFYLGAYLGNSHKVIYRSLAANNTGAGLDVDSLDEIFSVVQFASVNNGAEGITMAGNYGDYQAITTAQNKVHQLNYRSAGNPFLETFNNIAAIAADNTADGMYLECAEASNVGDVLAAYATTGINLAATATSIKFLPGDVLVGHNTVDCANAAGVVTLDAAGSNTCNHGPGLATAPVTGIDPRGSFVGVLGQNDRVNASAQTAGTAAFPVADWVHFENPWRGWGVAGSTTLFDALLQGNCAAAQTCQIYDWRLQAGDNLLLNHYGAFPADGGPCPSSVDATVADNVLVDLNTTSLRYLRAAVELLDPVVNPTGNFNGLCESNEACLYTPNLGAYQGSGELTTRTCAEFVNGNGVSGVSLYAYPQNGI